MLPATTREESVRHLTLGELSVKNLGYGGRTRKSRGVRTQNPQNHEELRHLNLWNAARGEYQAIGPFFKFDIGQLVEIVDHESPATLQFLKSKKASWRPIQARFKVNGKSYYHLASLRNIRFSDDDLVPIRGIKAPLDDCVSSERKVATSWEEEVSFPVASRYLMSSIFSLLKAARQK